MFEPGAEFRIQKRRAEAVVTLSNGESTRGWFFVAGGSSRHSGPERIGDLLNAESGFLPFEVDEGGNTRTVLYHRAHVVMVALGANAEARLDPGYPVARERDITLLLSNGRRLSGAIRIHRPGPQDRLSDWTRVPEMFRYVETDAGTFIVNVSHVVEVHESLDHE